MSDSELNQYEGTAKQLIEDINQLNKVALGEGAAACQVCGTKLPDGAPVTVFAYRPAGRPTYELAYVSCGENEHDLPTYFTLGVRDLLVDGHVGRCVDPATDSSWPVLLNPSVRAVSPMESTTARIAPTELPTSPPTESSTESPTNSTTDEVSWVYGDALLRRASENVSHNDPSIGTNPPTDHDKPVDEGEHIGTESSQIPCNDSVGVGVDSAGDDANHAADGDEKPPADVDDGTNGPPTDTDSAETNVEKEGGEC